MNNAPTFAQIKTAADLAYAAYAALWDLPVPSRAIAAYHETYKRHLSEDNDVSVFTIITQGEHDDY